MYEFEITDRGEMLVARRDGREVRVEVGLGFHTRLFVTPKIGLSGAERRTLAQEAVAWLRRPGLPEAVRQRPVEVIGVEGVGDVVDVPFETAVARSRSGDKMMRWLGIRELGARQEPGVDEALLHAAATDMARLNVFSAASAVLERNGAEGDYIARRLSETPPSKRGPDLARLRERIG